MAEFEDLDVYGNELASGEPVYYTGDSAVSNSIIAFVTSKKGDYINNPGVGGVLNYLLFKPMKKNMRKFKSEMLDGLTASFSKIVTFQGLTLEAFPEKRYWLVKIAYTSLLTGKTNLITLYTKGVFESNSEIGSGGVEASLEFINVDYEDENLTTFVDDHLVELKDYKLIYDINEESWVWYKYKLVNLTTESSNFSAILQAINT